jgi:hypothetical protein
MHCGQAHWSSRCKSISIPPEGFSKENGGGGHDHGDDEDEKIQFKQMYPPFRTSVNPKSDVVKIKV